MTSNMGQGFGPSTATAGSGDYEFSPQENATIERSGSRAQLWGTLSLVLGALMAVGGIAAAIFGGAVGAGIGLALVSLGAVSAVSGWFYRLAGENLRAVVTTHGDDVVLMTEAVNKLAMAFKVETIASIVGMVLGFVGGLAMAGVTGGAR